MGLWTEILLFNAMGATVLAAAVALAGRWIGRPTVRHALWLIVLLKLVGIPALEIALIPTRDHVWAFVAGGTEQPTSLPLMSAAVDPRPSATPGVRAGERMDRTDGWTRGEIGTPVATASAIDHRASNPPTPAARSVDWRWLFPLVAGLGTIALLGLATIRVFRFHRRLRVATEAPAGLQARANHLAIGVGLSGAPRIRVVPGRMSPSLWPGIGSCQILLPAALLADLSDAERDCLILHELAHVRRRDHWIRPLELLVTALYWWLPVAWWARRNLRVAEESACDALVVQTRPRGTRAYAEALLKTVEFISARDVTLPRLATGAGEPNRLEERVTMILTKEAPAGLPGRLRPLLLAGAMLALLVTPGWVKDAADPEEDEARTKETLVDEHRRLVEKQHHLEMLAIQHQELNLRRQLQELESRRVRIQLEYEAEMLVAEEARVRDEAQRLREEGLEDEAIALERDLQRMHTQATLHRQRVELEQHLEQRRMEIEFRLQELSMERERLVAEGEPDQAEALEEEMKAFEIQYRQLEIEALEGEINHTQQRLQQEMMLLDEQRGKDQKSLR